MLTYMKRHDFSTDALKQQYITAFPPVSLLHIPPPLSNLIIIGLPYDRRVPDDDHA